MCEQDEDDVGKTHTTYTHDDYVFTHMTRRFCDLATVAFYFGSQADPYT